jgi:hypothetical protein
MHPDLSDSWAQLRPGLSDRWFGTAEIGPFGRQPRKELASRDGLDQESGRVFER